MYFEPPRRGLRSVGMSHLNPFISSIDSLIMFGPISLYFIILEKPSL